MIRMADIRDAESIADLCAQLEYTISAEEIRPHLQQQRRAERAIAVHEREGRVLAWIEVQRRRSLESGEHAEITGLVVDEAACGKGIGAGLVAWARRWALERGFAKLRVRSNEKRAGAHRFYEREGFAHIKSQRVYDTGL